MLCNISTNIGTAAIGRLFLAVVEILLLVAFKKKIFYLQGCMLHM